MRRTALLAIASLAATPCLHADFVVGKTVPVGIVKLGDTTVGEPSVQANTDVYLSIPFLKPATISGEVSSITGSTVSLTNTTGSAASLPGKHYLVIESGSKAGLIALVDTSTANTVTVSLQPDDSLAGIAANDDFSLRPAWTLDRIFSDGVPDETLFSGWSGVTGGINPTRDLLFNYSAVDGWYDSSDLSAVGDTVIYPNETFIVRSPSSIEIPFLAISGEVPSIPSRAYILNTASEGRDNPFSYFSSSDEAIVDAGLSSVAQTVDKIHIRDNSDAGPNKPALFILEFNGTEWENTDDAAPIDETFKFEAGKGYIYRRSSTSSMTPTLWSDLPDYLPLD